MIERKHTPGPWHTGESLGNVYGPDGFCIAEAEGVYAISQTYSEGDHKTHWATTPGAKRDVSDEEAEFNAYLMSASPELLDVAELALHVLDAQARFFRGKQRKDLILSKALENELRRKARAAIAKATGDQKELPV